MRQRMAVCGAVTWILAVISNGAVASPMTSIADSYHNLGSTNSRTASPNNGPIPNHSLDTAEICVFCHTPHGGNISAAVPLWNRKLNDPLNYKRYSDLGTSTFDAAEAPVGSITIACLSCHDGTMAIDSVINAPGSGGYNPEGARLGNNFVGDDQGTRPAILEPPIVQNLTEDLSNDHPVSMQYAGGGISTGSLNGPTDDPDFVSGSTLHPRAFTLNNMSAPNPSSGITTLWWIERNDLSLDPAGRDRTDIILYTRLEAETGVAGGEQPFVECGSCHDPHNIDNPTFLRVSNGVPDNLQSDFPNAVDPDYGSALCLTCHTK